MYRTGDTIALYGLFRVGELWYPGQSISPIN